MIEIEGLRKVYDELVAVDELKLKIDDGEICGYVGPNGAGKTTTLKMLSTLIPPTDGSARVGGFDLLTEQVEIRKIMGFMPENMGFYEDMTVEEYMDFFGRVYRIAQRPSVIRDLLDLVDLRGKRRSLISSLSRGMRQRLGIAKTLIHDPQVLLLDEPASGVDPRARIELRELLKELRKMGKTIFISSHILPDLEGICDSLAIIEQGKLIKHGSIEEILESAAQHNIVELEVMKQDLKKAERILHGIDCVAAIKVVGDDKLLVKFTGDRETCPRLVKALVGEGVRLISFHERETKLDDAFLKITKGLVS